MRIQAIFLSISIFIFVFMGNIFSTSKTVSASGESNIGTDIYSNVETVNTDCMTHNEHLALKVRIMKDQIAVASRNCGNEEKKLFTEVSKKFENAFAANNIILEIFFNRFDTENPVKTMNDFITEIANASSLKAIYDKKNFCKTQKNLMDKILYIEPKDIPEFANKNITQKISNPKVCE